MIAGYLTAAGTALNGVNQITVTGDQQVVTPYAIMIRPLPRRGNFL